MKRFAAAELFYSASRDFRTRPKLRFNNFDLLTGDIGLSIVTAPCAANALHGSVVIAQPTAVNATSPNCWGAVLGSIKLHSSWGDLAGLSPHGRISWVSLLMGGPRGSLSSWGDHLHGPHSSWGTLRISLLMGGSCWSLSSWGDLVSLSPHGGTACMSFSPHGGTSRVSLLVGPRGRRVAAQLLINSSDVCSSSFYDLTDK